MPEFKINMISHGMLTSYPAEFALECADKDEANQIASEIGEILEHVLKAHPCGVSAYIPTADAEEVE